MVRCGCVDKSCSCWVRGGQGIHVDGTGGVNDPYVLSPLASATKIVGVSTAYMTVGVTGSGANTDPYVLSVTKSALTPPSLGWQGSAYTTAGTYTWTKPTYASWVRVVVIGGGSGGNGGGDTGTARLGGSGGGYAEMMMQLDPACTGATVVVGAGGVGGTGSDVGPGSLGGVGQASSVTWTGWSGSPVAAGGGDNPYSTMEKTLLALGSQTFVGSPRPGSGGIGASKTVGATLAERHMTYVGSESATNLANLRGGDGGAGEGGGATHGRAPGGGGGGGSADTGHSHQGGRGADGAVWIVIM